MTILHKSYGEWDDVDKPALVSIRYEVSDDQDIKMVPYNNNNNANYYVFSDSNNDNKKQW